MWHIAAAHGARGALHRLPLESFAAGFGVSMTNFEVPHRPTVQYPLPGMSSKSALVHVLCSSIAMVIVAFVIAVLADGKSVLTLKTNPPVVTNPAVVNATLAQLLGNSYGIGLHHDSSGRTWNEVDSPDSVTGGLLLNELIASLGAGAVLGALPTVIATDSLKHPIQFLSCIELRDTSMAAMLLGFIADIAAALMVIFHAAALAGLVKPKLAKMVSVLVWFVLSVGFLIVIILASVIFTGEWECQQPVIPTLKVDDHFDLNYGLPFACVGFVASVLALVSVVLLLSSAEPRADDKYAVDLKTAEL
jgi:hypothetical protein